MEAQRLVLVVNAAGLHARPCHALVSLALGFSADLRIAHDGHSVNGKSILELMTLAAGRGDELQIRAEGPDAQGLVDAVCALVAAGFEE